MTRRVMAALQSDPTLALILLDASGRPIWATPSVFSMVDLDMNAENPLRAACHPDDAALCEEVFRVEGAGRRDDRFTIDCRYELITRIRSPKGEWRRVGLRLINQLDNPDVEGFLLQLTLCSQELSAVAAFDSMASGAPVAVVIADLLDALETGGSAQGVAAVFDPNGWCIASSDRCPIGAGDHRLDERWRATWRDRTGLRVTVRSPRSGASVGILEMNSAFADVRPFTRSLVEQVSRRIAVVLDLDADRSELVRTAAFDALTGLSNRWSFRSAYQALPESLQVSIFFVDIDRFKDVNDTYGHEAGDAVLVELSRRLRSIAVEGDLTARLGGDEFILVRTMPMSDRYDPDCFVEVLADVLDGPVSYEGHEIPIRSSIGVSVGLVGDRRDLVARADADMYAAKRLHAMQRPSSHCDQLLSRSDLSLGLT